MRLLYSPQSIQDLKRVREFIAQNNPLAASRVAADLLARIEQLRSFPEIGKIVIPPQPEIQSPTPIRDFVFGNYIIRYVCLTDAITILRIWHHYENR